MPKQVRQSERSSAGRIETQIHRRSKAKATSPLESEWEGQDKVPPRHLRMPSTKMGPPPTKPAEK